MPGPPARRRADRPQDNRGHDADPQRRLTNLAAALEGTGRTDEAIIARGEKALPDVIRIPDGWLTNHKWLLGADFSLVDCAYCPILNVVEKAGFSFAEFPRVSAYLDATRARPAWKETPKLPGM